MSTLVLLICEDWPEQSVTDWVLLDSHRKVIEEGRSEFRHWPQANSTVAVLAEGQVSLCSVRLPHSRRQDRDRLISFALEERLPSETESEHFTLLEQDGDQAIVAIVQKVRLRRIVEYAKSCGRPLSSVFGILQCMPRVPGSAVCFGTDSMRYWRWPDGSGCAEDVGALDQPISWQIQKCRELMPVLYLLGRDDLASALRLTCSGESKARWYETNKSKSVLHGEFAPGPLGPSRTMRLRWPIWMFICASLAHICVGLASAALGRNKESELRERTEAQFRTLFPGAAIIDPVLQMRRQLNEIRPRQGAMRDDDLLVLLSALAESLQPEGKQMLSKLHYQSGALEVVLSAPSDSNSIAKLSSALRLRGVAVKIVSEADHTISLTRDSL